MTGRDYCSRRDLECRPGAEGCVLRGRVVFAGDDATVEDTPGAARRNQGGTPGRPRPASHEPRDTDRKKNS
ncbi:MAG: hypothetical protein EA404_12110 [Spirochaetaceae bacterium]|nr:MAG: hypothetical protein EA404_12110 [Spirochaetaceae bacterium]